MGNAVAKRSSTAVKRKLKPIADVVLQFKASMCDGNYFRLKAAKLLLELRERIEAGEEGEGVEWWPWCEQHIERGRKDCEALLRIASAPDSQRAYDEERERIRLAVAEHRAEKEARLLLTTNGDEPKPRRRTKKEVAAEAEAVERHEKQEVAIKAAWLRDHPERTPEEYEELLADDDQDSPMWLWRRAMGRAWAAAERDAWHRDHPERTLPEHMCSLSDEESAEYYAWKETYEPPVVSVPEGTYGLGLEPKRKHRTSAEVDAEHAAERVVVFETLWDAAEEAMREKYLHHIVRESDPVSLGLAVVLMMDGKQLRRFCAALEEHKLQHGKRASMLPRSGRSEDDRGDPNPQNSAALFAKLETELKRGTKNK
jgi:hypothetical protein